MSRIRSSGTKPEIAVRAVLTALGIPHRCNVSGMPGSPDVVVHGMKVAIFIDGCYWHGCPKHFRLPSSNRRFWQQKILANRRRDKSVRSELRELGWSVWSYWEHDLRDLLRFVRNIRRRFSRIR